MNKEELSQKDYLSTLDNVIYNWVIENGKEPNHIVMNPNTWQYIGSQWGLIQVCFYMTSQQIINTEVTR